MTDPLSSPGEVADAGTPAPLPLPLPLDDPRRPAPSVHVPGRPGLEADGPSRKHLYRRVRRHEPPPGEHA